MMRGVYKKNILTTAVLAVFAVLLTGIPIVHAQSDEGFSLQVSPSPLVATVQPGTDTVLQLQIRNTSSSPQALKMGLRSFTIEETNGQVQLGDTAPKEVASLVSFGSPTFTLAAGEIFTEHVHIKTDKNSGFSYNFAVTISQQNPPKGAEGKSAIAGSVAVFTLISVDRQGATREIQLNSLSMSKRVYEFLPAEISVSLKNTGNTNVQPAGSVFIYRHADDTNPLASLPLNDSGGFILPGKSRVFTVSWNDGFPHYQTTQEGDSSKRQLLWQGSDGVSGLRFGRYVAKIVAIYNDGQRDVPVMADVNFWVVPWRIILVVLAVVISLLVGVIVMIRSAGRTARKVSRKIRHKDTAKTQHEK